jgi:hypothetical protein
MQLGVTLRCRHHRQKAPGVIPGNASQLNHE